MIAALLFNPDGHLRRAAKILNLSPSTLRSRMHKLGIRRPIKPS